MRKNEHITFTENKWLMSCAALAAGEYTVISYPALYNLWPLIAALALVLLTICHKLGGWLFRFSVIFFIGFGAALLAVGHYKKTIGKAAEYGSLPQEITVKATEDAKISRAKKRPIRYASFPARWEGNDIRVIMELPAEGIAAPKCGEHWRCVGYLQQNKSNDITARPILWVRGSKCRAERIPSQERTFDKFIRHLRHDISRRMKIGHKNNRDAVALNHAILLGDKKLLQYRTRQAFIDSGMIHVFAISGLHVMVIAKSLMFLSTFGLFSTRFSGVAVMPAVWLYVLVTGSPASAVRAAMMASIVSAAPLFFRRANWITAWSITFIILHLISPFNLVRAGSAFSFVVMLSLVLSSHIIDNLCTKRLTKALCFSFVAWAAGVPIAARLFGRISIAGIVGNVLMVPSAAAATVASAGGVACSYLSARVAAYLNNLAGLILNVMAGFATFASRIPFSHLRVQHWPLSECALWYAALAALLWLANQHVNRRYDLTDGTMWLVMGQTVARLAAVCSVAFFGMVCAYQGQEVKKL